MAEAGTLCTNGDTIKFAGASASSVSAAEAYTNVYIKEAEGFVCASARYDYVTNYASVSTIGKEMLRLAAASLAAISVIEYDMSGYTSLAEAQTMIQVCWDTVRECINLLTDKNYHNFIMKGNTT